MKPHKLLVILILLGTFIAVRGSAQEKPLTKDQVTNLVRNQLGDETGARAIRDRGIDFQPTEDFLQALSSAGAKEVFLQALRDAATPPKPPAVVSPPTNSALDLFQIFGLLIDGVPNQRIAELVAQRGIAFRLDSGPITSSATLQSAGADEALLQAFRAAKVYPSDPAALKKHAEAAEPDYAARLKQDPRNRAVRLALGYALDTEGKSDRSIALYREGTRLEPNDFLWHEFLAGRLLLKGDLADAIPEYREVIRLRPTDVEAHRNLGVALISKGDLDGAISELREAIRLRPTDPEAHNGLGMALMNKGDLDGAAPELRLALRLKPDLATAHEDLGIVLARKGDPGAALAEFREGLRLSPGDPTAHFNLGLTLEQTGDVSGAISEYRVALRLKPDYAPAQTSLAQALARQNGPATRPAAVVSPAANPASEGRKESGGQAGQASPGVPAEELLQRGREAYEAKRYTEAFPLFSQAALAGNAKAMTYLGVMCERGFGVAQDYQLARMWYDDGAGEGDAEAMLKLGFLYERGFGVAQDYQQARQWYEKGAAAGNAQAMTNMGVLYQHGFGVTQDYQQARQWYQKAAAAGNKDAEEDLKRLPLPLAASTPFSQAPPPPAATLIQGTYCTVDKSHPGKARCHKGFIGKDYCWPEVNEIDGTINYGPRRRKPDTVLVQLMPGEHTVNMFQCAYGNVCGQPATAKFTAVPGHTYSVDILLDSSKIRHTRWVPLIYDETDNRMVSLPKPPWQ